MSVIPVSIDLQRISLRIIFQPVLPVASQSVESSDLPAFLCVAGVSVVGVSRVCRAVP